MPGVVPVNMKQKRGSTCTRKSKEVISKIGVQKAGQRVAGPGEVAGRKTLKERFFFRPTNNSNAPSTGNQFWKGKRMNDTLAEDLTNRLEDDGQDIEPEAFLNARGKRTRHGQLTSSSAMERRSPSTSLSLFLRRKRQQITFFLKKVMANKGSSWSQGCKQSSAWKTSSPVTDCQSSKDKWTKADRKETRWRDVTRRFHEAGLQIKDKTFAWDRRRWTLNLMYSETLAKDKTAATI